MIVGRHSDFVLGLAQHSGAGVVVSARPRNPYSLPIFSFWIALAIVLVTVIAPDGSASAAQTVSAPARTDVVQNLVVAGTYKSAVVRDNYRATKRVIPAATPAAGIPDPGTAQAIAYAMLQARGWGDDQYGCLVALWNRESHWNVYAHNVSSGAYGIPQALPGTKMASAGADWATNPKTQITWGLSYITGRYGTPCGAWAAFQNKGWY